MSFSKTVLSMLIHSLLSDSRQKICWHISTHYDIEHRETSKELFRVYLETRSKNKLDFGKYTIDFITSYEECHICKQLELIIKF